MHNQISCETPIGRLHLTEENQKIDKITLLDETALVHEKPTPLLMDACNQINNYFNGNTEVFSIPILQKGTIFQKKVWTAIRQIPYGKTWSYKKVAREIGHENSYRAVGNALNKNPHLIVVPCHRVIRDNHTLGGFGAGSELKDYLIRHETYHKNTFEWVWFDA